MRVFSSPFYVNSTRKKFSKCVSKTRANHHVFVLVGSVYNVMLSYWVMVFENTVTHRYETSTLTSFERNMFCLERKILCLAEGGKSHGDVELSSFSPEGHCGLKAPQ